MGIGDMWGLFGDGPSDDGISGIGPVSDGDLYGDALDQGAQEFGPVVNPDNGLSFDEGGYDSSPAGGDEGGFFSFLEDNSSLVSAGMTAATTVLGGMYQKEINEETLRQRAEELALGREFTAEQNALGRDAAMARAKVQAQTQLAKLPTREFNALGGAARSIGEGNRTEASLLGSMAAANTRALTGDRK